MHSATGQHRNTGNEGALDVAFSKCEVALEPLGGKQINVIPPSGVLSNEKITPPSSSISPHHDSIIYGSLCVYTCVNAAQPL